MRQLAVVPLVFVALVLANWLLLDDPFATALVQATAATLVIAAMVWVGRMSARARRSAAGGGIVLLAAIGGADTSGEALVFAGYGVVLLAALAWVLRRVDTPAGPAT